MLYINKNAQSAVLYIPTNGYDFSPESLVLDIYNTTDKGVENLEIITPTPAADGFLIRLAVVVPIALYAGEWKYELKELEGGVIATGLLVVYDGARPSPAQYEDELNIIQYGG